MKAGRGGFSLLEVLMAAALGAGALAAAFAALGPVGRRQSDLAAAVDAAALGVPLEAWIRFRHSADRSAAASFPIYANRAGTRIGGLEDGTWKGGGGERFYEIAIQPTEEASRFGVRVHWPVAGRQRQEVFLVIGGAP